MKTVQTIAFWGFLLMIGSPHISAQTMNERKQIVEDLRQQFNTNDSSEWKAFFSFAYYADRAKVFYMEVGRTDFLSNTKYIKRYDIKSGTSAFFVPLQWNRGISMNLNQYDNPIQRAIFEDEKRLVLIEMDFQKETWKTILYFPEGTRFDQLKEIPQTTLLAFSYPLNNLNVGFTDQFGLAIVDWITGDRKTIFEKISHQNSIVSSNPPCLPYEFIDKDTLLYLETINPYQLKSTDSINDTLTADKKTYDSLWCLNLVSRDKIQVATGKLQLTSCILRKEGYFEWSGITIKSATEISKPAK